MLLAHRPKVRPRFTRQHTKDAAAPRKRHHRSRRGRCNNDLDQPRWLLHLTWATITHSFTLQAQGIGRILEALDARAPRWTTRRVNTV